MRVVRLANSTVVFQNRHNVEVVVALPARLSESDILAMASLVLSGDEFAELAGSLVRSPDPAVPPAAP
jgi:hypothetical protein